MDIHLLITTATLNVREQASTSSNIVGTVSSGQTVTITAKNGVWYKISSPKVGYVHSDYININSVMEMLIHLL